MALTKSRGNMYPFVTHTHTWNAIKGICFHDCPYCYNEKIQWSASYIMLVLKIKTLCYENDKLYTDYYTGNCKFYDCFM